MKKKITKVLIGIVIFLLAIYFLLSKYVVDQLSMEARVGAKLGGGELTIKENSILAKCVDTYLDKIKNGDYESAYKMLGSSYREFVKYEDWLNKVNELDKDTLFVNNPSIKIMTKTTFDVPVGASGELQHYLVIINEISNSFSIYPDLFLENVEGNFKSSNKKIDYCINSYTVYGDKILLSATIKNNNKSDVTLSNISLMKNDGTKPTLENEIILAPDEIKTVEFEFQNDYAFPNWVSIDSLVKGKLVNTKIEFKNKLGGVK